MKTVPNYMADPRLDSTALAITTPGSHFLSLLAVALLALLPALSAVAGGGGADTSFAGTGSTRLGFGFGEDFGRAATVQPDGKLLVAGSTGLLSFAGTNLAVVRYDTNNVLDPSFGIGGIVNTPVASSTNTAFSFQVATVGVQSDNKIVIAGTAFDEPQDYLVLVRLNPDGSLDNSFGQDGIVTNNFGQNLQGNTMVIQPDGKFVIAVSSDSGFAIARFKTNGLPDTSFAGTGLVTDFATGDAGAYGVTLQSDGKIVACGTGGFNLAVLRYTTNGVLDTSFGPAHNGKVFTHAGINGALSFAYAVAIEPGDNISTLDRIVIAGTTESTFPINPIVVVRYNLDGSLDGTFAGGGMVITSVGPGGDFINSLLIQGTGSQPRKIIVSGSIDTGADFDQDFCVVRYNDNGNLDSSFNGGGIVTTSFGPGADQSFGMTFFGANLLLAGSTTVNDGNADFAMVRYHLSDGSLDSSFGKNGKLTQDITDRTSMAKAVALQADGKIIAAGNAFNGQSNTFVMARFTSAGALDPSFGFFGKIIIPFGGNDSSANAIALQPDGKIVVAGSANNGTDDDFAIARYTTNGTLDASFNGTGKLTTAIDTGEDAANAVKIQPDGKIVAAGFAVINHAAVDFAAVRYTTNGILDPSFGSFGRVATPIEPSGAVGNALAIQPDGKILIAGYTADGSSVDIAVVRYATNGTLDLSFDGDGKVTTSIGLSTDFASSIALQNDGKILVAGFTTIGAHPECATVRYTTNGSLDDSYGLGGAAIADFGDNADNTAAALALDSLGRAVLVGTAGNLLGVARLQGDPFAKILALARLPNGHSALTGVGVPNGTHTLQAAPDMLPGNFQTIGSVVPNADGNWQFDDATAAPLPRRFYRLILP